MTRARRRSATARVLERVRRLSRAWGTPVEVATEHSLDGSSRRKNFIPATRTDKLRSILRGDGHMRRRAKQQLDQEIPDAQ